ncbi:receptor-like serine/threonine-protein kinase SD1-8 isoform X2 [Carex rostrata]
MKIGKNLAKGFEWFLSSWKSGMDPSKGNYYYKMDTMGVPQNVLWNGAQIRFRTGPWDGLRFSGIPEMKTYENMFSFILVSEVNEVYYSFEAKQGTPLSRLVLNETGVVQRMVWDQTSRTWNEFWYGPKDPCDYYGKCGPFGICNINEVTLCSSLQGFYPKSYEEWSMRNFSGGCKRKTPLSCHDNDNGFYLIKGVKVPDPHPATVDAGISIEDCRNRCLMNCSCLAYSVLDIRGGGSGCITWSNDLLDIRYISGAQDLYIKAANIDIAGAGNNRRRIVLIGTIASATIALLLIILLAGIMYWRKVLKEGNLDQSCSLKNTEIPLFDLVTVAASTGNFSPANELGQGAFGIVYKGQLPNGEEIAVKRLSKNVSQGQNEFMNEVMLIAKLQHRNLVRLLGCCIHASERMLIYEYMSNKSLDFFIFHEERCKLLNWRSRSEIIIGIARGLLYLHQDSRFNIIHRDLKAANILLDGEMTPKISDFGTARLFRREENEMATEIVVGTRGYMSPEYAMEGIMSVKSDVYSFGVLLLEIISGKRNYGNQNLLAYAWKFWEEGKAEDLADEAIIDCSSVQSELARCVHVGLLCVQECADDRPTTSTVLLMLSSGSATLPEPKKPVLCTRITSQLTLCEHLFHSTS